MKHGIADSARPQNENGGCARHVSPRRASARGAVKLFAAVAAILAGAAAPALDLQLKGKTALVTGSTQNIGYAVAKVMLEEGAEVIINARSQGSVDKAIAALKEATGRTPRAFVGDMGKAEDIARLVKAYPSVDVLVNNVAMYQAIDFVQTTDEDWENMYRVNVLSGVRLSRAYLPGMKQRNWGRIIFISSENALQIPAQAIHYGVTKAAEIALARGLAETCAKTGVTVNSILPGPTRDTRDPAVQEAVKRAGKTSFAEVEDEFFRKNVPTSLIWRFAQPEEVASLVAYVASPLSSATTGAALRVDGGVVKSAF
jgi:NAD(P)-dependent dehydrogenase (short-subunit alcohol dehydrogenase family)